MLNYLKFHNVGPAPEMELKFGPRLNLLTGDNSLGKTFALDVAWWALTQSWPGKGVDAKKNMAWPLEGKRQDAVISASYGSKTYPMQYTSPFNQKNESWPSLSDPEKSNSFKIVPNLSLTLYLRADGGFSLWDPIRNNWTLPERKDFENQDNPKSFDFDMNDIWNGLRSNGDVYCEGLLSDWKTWKDREGQEFELLQEILRILSPNNEKPMEAGPFTKLSLSDVREIPTIETSYGNVPVTVASAGMKRILALAYLIVWAHTEHLKACKLTGYEAANQFTVLIDEVELHLHPQWQRTLLPAVLAVIKKLGPQGAIQDGGIFPQVQVIASTHAPLVMASVETDFDESLDTLTHFKIEEGEVKIEEGEVKIKQGKVVAEQIPWSRQGDAVGWLVSDVFGLQQARSKEAEKAIEAAEAFMLDGIKKLPDNLQSQEQIHKELLRVLPDHDKFWPRWIVKTENAGQ